MLTYGEAPMAYGLTRGMARVIGVDLVRAVTEGWISRDDLAGLVDTCAACTQRARCAAWLGETVAAPALPGYCANKSGLEALRN